MRLSVYVRLSVWLKEAVSGEGEQLLASQVPRRDLLDGDWEGETQEGLAVVTGGVAVSVQEDELIWRPRMRLGPVGSRYPWVSSVEGFGGWLFGAAVGDGYGNLTGSWE